MPSGPSLTRPTPGRSPYFWSHQYGIRIQFSGHAELSGRIEIEAGDAEGHSFLAFYYRGDDPVGMLSSAQTRLFAKRRGDVERSQRARRAETHGAPLN
ncbi:oxidoreductase C-terminal domain-containing protein [Arthrobacter sp. GCM10027362]|uniref:oxidoreductase C-terminal domain-containing protein n=1 Tax=Arthrobacter sp. GCM10027362 TaxID=3273379 RepID=UPI003630F594